jgi:hypothetical protein
MAFMVTAVLVLVGLIVAALPPSSYHLPEIKGLRPIAAIQSVPDTCP